MPVAPDPLQRTAEELDAALPVLQAAPRGRGRVELIVRRPVPGQRDLLEEATFDEAVGLVGDGWSERTTTSTPDGRPHPGKQVTLINATFSALVAGPGATSERRALAGDQLHVDLDLSAGHLPAGTRLAVGTAVLEISPEPHLGCAKFTVRFGLDASRLLRSDLGRALRLRGVNAFVVQGGLVRRGDEVAVLPLT